MTGGADRARCALRADPGSRCGCGGDAHPRDAGRGLDLAGEWRTTELLDDAVEIERGVRYGNVDDLIIDRGGDVRAIVVDADSAAPPGRYAFPWRRDRFERDRGVHQLPYDRAQINRLRPFDYGALGIASPRHGKVR